MFKAVGQNSTTALRACGNCMLCPGHLVFLLQSKDTQPDYSPALDWRSIQGVPQPERKTVLYINV